MALYRLEVKTFSRGGGRSAVAAAAYRSTSQSAVAAASYRSGEDLYSQADRETKKARTSGEVVHSEILAPEGAPDWARDRQSLWNEVEAREKRKDSRLAREVLVSLPRELDRDKQRELVQEFTRNDFVSRGMVADVNIHESQASDGEKNPHAHILLTVRGVDPEGWDQYAAGGKDRPWNKSERVQEWRASWEEHCNRYLEESGSTERVDHRSLKDRGLDRRPEPKLGPRASSLEKRGKRTRLGDERRRVLFENAYADGVRVSSADWRDSHRSASMEMAFNGQMPPEVRARFEEMRQRIVTEREARREALESATGQPARMAEIQQYLNRHAEFVNRSRSVQPDSTGNQFLHSTGRFGNWQEQVTRDDSNREHGHGR